MFLVYAIPIGIVLGYLGGGRLERLTRLRLLWVPLITIGLIIQVAVFTEVVGGLLGPAGPAVYVASTALVFIAVLRNLRVPGVPFIALGALSNLVAIAANGGWMPAAPEAMRSVGGLGAGYANSIVLPQPALGPLTDVFALPAWLPLANVFSIGDVLIAVGITAAIARAMRSRDPGIAGAASGAGPASATDPLARGDAPAAEPGPLARGDAPAAEPGPLARGDAPAPEPGPLARGDAPAAEPGPLARGARSDH